MNGKIKQILELAIHAPSGENCQPWRFEVRDNTVSVYNIPERDNSLYSWGQRASYVAHGALLENIYIAAPAFGYTPQVTLFPDSTKPDYVVHITFQESQSATSPLYPFIKERVTNRRPYKKFTLTEEQHKEFSRISEGIDRGRILFLEKDEDKKTVAQAVAGNERILFENPLMHKFFYDHITWTESEDREKKIGFYIKTFELPPPAQGMFKLAKNPGFVRNVNKIGFSKLIAKQNAKVYASASAMGTVIMPSNSAQDFLLAGRLMQRIWLTATKLGLNLQPLTGILFLMQKIEGDGAKELTETQRSFVQKQYQQIQRNFGAADENVAMLFRIGDGGKPTARSLRLSPEIHTEEIDS